MKKIYTPLLGNAKFFWMACLMLICFSITSQAFAQQAREQFITTSDGVKLFVKRSGKGLPVLFVHGGPGSTFVYFEVEGGNVLEKDVEMIYLDQRGCGSSSTPENGDFSLERLIQDFEEVREQLGIEQWVVLTHSFGGLMGVNYAHQYPESVKGLVLLNSVVSLPHALQSSITASINLLELNPEDYPQEKRTVDLLFGEMFNQLHAKGIIHKLWFDSAQAKAHDDSVMMNTPLNRAFANNALQIPEYHKDYFPITAEIKTPVLVVHGSRDYAVGPDHPNYMLFPNMEVKMVEGGHALYLEHNEAFYEAVSPFLKKMTE
jgi:proline iminopeptidase